MLRLLKSGRCGSIVAAAKELNYSFRRCHRWLSSYRSGGLGELLENHTAECGRREWDNSEAWQALQKVLEAGEIATYKQAQELLAEHKVHYKDETGVLRLFRRHHIKLRPAATVTRKLMSQSKQTLKKFAERLKEVLSEPNLANQQRRIRVFAMDEARFGLISWHKRHYCSKGTRPAWLVRRKYEWTWLYAAVEPATGEDFCLYLSRLDGDCFELFLQHLSRYYPDDILILVRDNAPTHVRQNLNIPANIVPLALPPYSPELNPAERWFLEFRRALANQFFDSLDALETALTDVLETYWHNPAALKQLTNFSWWKQAVQQL